MVSTSFADLGRRQATAAGAFRRQAGDFSSSRVAVAPCAQGVQAPISVVGFRAGAAPGRYGSAHCRAMSRGQSAARNGAAAEEFVRITRLV